ncbi:MAG: hypothetical protein QF903_03660 [Planctomycetota bacterium]|jgi:HEAT repeat protein|nr:hypothetical protein [Planctomycetota bacterium]MDP6762721.1 hypothetical protein [Planctomycetota bacterium]MDP6988553.1 hypothetical protein [Planctomycetota bacterium]
MGRRAPGGARLATVLCLIVAPIAPAADVPALGAQPASAPQDQPAGDAETDLERYLRLARQGSTVVRPQAAQRLVGLGAPAAERLLAECAGSPAGMALLGRHVVEVLGSFGDPRLRERLWRALADPDFPWRPAAARALAAAPPASEGAAIVALYADPLAAVRTAAVEATAALERVPRVPALRALLADTDARVRRAAAALLLREGEGCASAWLLEELRRDDRFFEQPDGKLARYAAARLLATAFGDSAGFDAEHPLGHERNAAAARELSARCRAACGGELPAVGEVARAGGPLEGVVIGLELLSCRKGEFFLRWSVADELFVGAGTAVRVQLPKGTTAALLAESTACFDGLGERRLFGEPGCDLERFRLRPDPSVRSRAAVVSKGQAAVEGLRPAALSRLAERLVATLPEDGDDPRLRRLRSRVAEALAAIGG